MFAEESAGLHINYGYNELGVNKRMPDSFVCQQKSKEI